MLDDRETIPTDALEAVTYLSRSANRVLILAALTNGPTSRRVLTEETGVSRTTLDRIVNELDDRDWAERTTDGDYVATPAGSQLMREFEPLVGSVDAIQQLGATVGWLPTDELAIGLHHFRNAEVRRPTQADPAETVDFMTDLVANATEFRALTHLVPPGQLDEEMVTGVRDRGITQSGVMAGEAIDFIRNEPARRDRWHDMLAAGATVYRYDGELPCNLWIMDETVLLKKSGPGPIAESYGIPIVSRDETVHKWARDLFDRYRDEATQLDAETFAAEAV